jgi:dienelactone hydrolase
MGLAGACALVLGQSGALAQGADFAQLQAQWDKLPDTPGDGPYPALMEVDPTLGDYVVYRPADLSPFRPGGLGVFVWGNGACVDDGASSRQHLAEIASHGYLVIAPGKWRSGPNAKAPHTPQRPPNADGTIPTPPTAAADLRTALHWALDENARADSHYAGLIDENAVAVGGFSCGGIQALEIAADPRIRTVVIQNSGIFNDGKGIGGMNLTKDALKALHTPVLYLLGGPTDIAYANGTDDFARIGQVPVVLVNIPTGHGGTYNEPMGGKGARIVTDWLQWQLRHDAKAQQAFIGEDCGLCRDPDATIERKNLP